MKRTRHADIIDVANHAGVSPATVSRTFNHPSKVKPVTRKRIQKAIEETGYIRNRAAQAIHGKRSGTIGLIVPTLDNAIFANLIQAFSEELSKHGFTMLVSTHSYDLVREYSLVRSILEHRVEGIALIGLEHRDETYALLERRETPIVTMWNYAENARVSCVGADNHAAGLLIAQHVIDCGHRDIALVFPDTTGNDRADARYHGVRQALDLAEIKIDPIYDAHSNYSLKDARKAGISLLSRENHPSAVICGNDVIAQGVIIACHTLNLKVPQDVSIVGIGDFSGSADFYPSLTTVRLRSNAVGLKAAEMLVRQINGEDVDNVERVKIPVELKNRESVISRTHRSRAP